MTRFTRWITLLIALCGATAAFAQGNAAIQDHCWQGGTHAVTSGLSSTNYQQGIIPSCTVTVYLTGTQTKATIYSNIGGTPLANPFTANASSSADPGGWTFWAAVNQGYDIVMNGGISPNTYPAPVTLTDRYPGFSFSGGGGGGATPCGTNGQIQVANAAGTQLNCDPNFFIDTTAHEFTSTANSQINAMSSTPRALFDPVDTKYLGGLAAAVAGTSGHTPTQVIQAALDAGECYQIASGNKGVFVRLPPWTINITGLKMWSYERLGADAANNPALLQHADATQPMITGHGSSDTLVCNGTTYTPGGAGTVEISNIGIGGMNTGAQDIGIYYIGSGWWVHDIAGFSNGFGQQAIYDNGFENFSYRLGYPGRQLKGCQDYINGVSAGTCGTVYINSIDGEADYIYATDAAEQLSGKGPGPCYPNCAAIQIGATNVRAFRLFPQISDIGVMVSGYVAHIGQIRADATSMEGVRVTNSLGGNVIEDVDANGPCESSTLQSNYNAHIATGCFGIYDNGTGDIISGIQAAGSAFFGNSYINCQISYGQIGSSGTPPTYSDILYLGNPDNNTPNDLSVCGGSGLYANSAPRVAVPDMLPVNANTGMVNLSGLSSVALNTSTALTQANHGTAGQRVTVFASSSQVSATVAPTAWDGTAGHLGIYTCSGLPETVTATTGISMMVSSSFNMLSEICNTPNFTPTHVNYSGNPTPTSPSLLDVYGNAQARQVPGFSLGNAIQLHGPSAPSGQACFVQEWLFTDGSHVVSSQSCTTVDLSAQTPGAVFVFFPSPNQSSVVTVNLWMVSNSEPNGIAIGKFPAHTNPPGASLWDGPTTIAAGGNGASITPGDNSTGEFWGLGTRQVCPNPLPACSAEYAQMICSVPGSGATADVNQICSYVGSGTYSWQPLGAGSGGVGPGTVNTLAMFTTTTQVGNSPLSVSGGALISSDPFKVNDATGNGGSWTPSEGTQPSTAGSGVDSCYGDSTAHAILCNFNNGGWKQVPLYTTGTNSPLLQWTSFNSTNLSGTNTSGIGSELVGAPGSTFTITRVDMVLATAPVGCTTAAVVSLYDVTTPSSPVEVSATFEITLVNGTRFYTITPGSPFALTLAHNYMWGIKTATSGCSTSPAAPYWTTTYTVQ